ncbi:MAG TPA: hypothetical protein VFV95_07170 [Vicinamibacterales bacterium]|nr:hypothetical protein [Vicinamibacterales bacterium]
MRPNAVSAVVMLASTVACTSAAARVRTLRDTPPPSKAQLSELWVEPGNAARDLFWGSGGREHAPRPNAVYTLVSEDTSGFSVSYDVRSPDETEWSAKVGPEAQTEVVVSRILWGLGYQQPPVYYLPSWKLAGGHEGQRDLSEARLRPKLAGLHRHDEPWRWSENPFVGARELRGLLVVLLMLNSTDLKDENNSVYDVIEPVDGVRRWFVVRDLGAALGETGKWYPRRNWLDGFEKSRFITRVSADRIEFGYHGRHQELLSLITPDDLRWASARLRRLTDKQWHDAFRAGNYDEVATGRYLRVIRQRMADAAVPRPDSTVTERH